VRRSVAVLVLFAGLLPGCDAQPGYFPMQSGLTWQYEVNAYPSDSDGVATSPGGRGVSTFRTLPARQLDGRQVSPQSVELGGRFAVSYHAEDGAGVHVVAVQESGEATPRLTPGRLVMRYPLVVGGAWDDRSESMFLSGGRAELPGETRITSLDASVTVPAGTYTHCLELQFSGRGEVQRPSRSDLTPLRIDATSWYAPGVGLVKYVQRDRSPDGSGTLIAELTAFRTR
jgi:hypothetical protein